MAELVQRRWSRAKFPFWFGSGFDFDCGDRDGFWIFATTGLDGGDSMGLIDGDD